MNAQRLLTNFDRMADAPDAIPRLRHFVLDLAVRGKLVKQDPEDEPSSELLKRIASEKARLIKAGNLRRRNLTDSGLFDDLGFDLPSGWSVARFSDVLIELQTGPFGSSLHQRDYEIGGTPVINPASIQDGKIIPIKKMAVGENTLERLSRFKLQAGDIVMGRRGEMGRCAVVSEHQDGWLCGTGSLILRLPENICPKYLAMLIGSPYVRKYLARSAVGTTMRNLNQSILLRMSIAVPPIAEQKNIVAKVNELMVLCDRLEEMRVVREDIRDQVTEASYTRLRVSDVDDVTFRSHARFAVDVLPALTARSDQVKRLRQTILALAVQGKLVEQDSSDEPASSVLDRAGDGKSEGVKPLKHLGELDANELRDIPGNWCRSRVGSILDFRYGKALKASDRTVDGPVPVYGSNGIVGYTTEPLTVQPSVIVGRKGSAGALNKCNGPSWTTDVAYFVEVPSYFDLDFLFISLTALNLSELGKGVKPGLSRADAYRKAICIPPPTEQHRIVAKVNELMTLCDRLEAGLGTIKTSRDRLLESKILEALKHLQDEMRVAE